MALNIKPGGYFKIVVFLIGFLGGVSLFSNWFFEYRASSLLFQNLDEVHRSQKAGYEYLELKRDVARLLIATQFQQKNDVLHLRDSIRLKLRSLRKELNLWRYAVEADMSLASEAVKILEQDELNELLELSQLVIDFESDTHRFLVSLFEADDNTSQYFELYQVWQDELKPLDYAFENLVRETKAENYLEFEEFENQLSITWYLDVILLVLALLLSLLFAYLDKKSYQKPLHGLKHFLLKVRNQQPAQLQIGHLDPIYKQIENKLNAVFARFEAENIELNELVRTQSEELSRLRHSDSMSILMLDSVLEALIKTSFTGEILYYNQALTDLLAGSKIELVRNISSIITFRYENGVALSFEQIIKDTTAHTGQGDSRILLIDTSSGPLRVSVIIKIINAEVLISIIDATSLYTQQAQSNLINSLYDSFNQSVWLLDEHWNVLDVNSEVCRQRFVQKNELMGRRMPLIELLLTQQKEYQQITQHLKSHTKWQGDLNDLNHESQPQPSHVVIQKLLYPSHLGTYLVLVEKY